MKGKRFDTESELVNATEDSIREINSQHCLIGIRNLPERWKQIMKNKGDYYKSN